ncbi:19484_t:CDS:2 [Funneliformis geosporum]|uniref:19484_t:CDS:1 n=1 Tax=Funneliformis geosporum TaxID=1117311 RepID=A0A9W4SV39_9GLOM|nr:19484_t:CDS:2 [Funneliformis geosporum]
MVKKIRSDKKDTTCNHCSRILANPNKLHKHFKRKNPYRINEFTSVK